ncbi:MAG: cytochrome oxidase subunit I [SAR86 cluster bacterium SAR86B]|uniref:Cytochrome oxidase subunit I n=1 Tax=SAR86 cluster bacterium SAR86B TaxID=1123867 RepID=J4KSR4_9GAMM|nr:MAG: cytochrome oxidase subunit I [SAR86 cluster bacterium SAR86B]
MNYSTLNNNYKKILYFLLVTLYNIFYYNHFVSLSIHLIV